MKDKRNLILSIASGISFLLAFVGFPLTLTSGRDQSLLVPGIVMAVVGAAGAIVCTLVMMKRKNDVGPNERNDQ